MLRSLARLRDAGAVQSVNLSARVTQPTHDFLRMRSRFGSWDTQLALKTVDIYRIGDEFGVAKDWRADWRRDTKMLNLRVREHFVYHIDRAGWNPRGFELFHQ